MGFDGSFRQERMDLIIFISEKQSPVSFIHGLTILFVTNQTHIQMRTSFTVLMTFLISGTIWTQEIHTQSNAASLNNEADATVGWTGGAVISTNDTDVQHGSFAMTITSTGQTSGRNAEYSFSVVSGQVYNITIWAKRAPQSYLPAFANWTGFSNFSERAISTTNWTAYNFELTANSNTAIIRIYTSPINRGDIAGDGVLIDAVSITPLVLDDQAPTAITDLVAGSTTSTTTTLSWSASTDNVAVVDYELFQDGVSIGLSGGNTSFNVTNLTPDTAYTFTAVAIDAAGNTSAVSNTVNITTSESPIGGIIDYTSENSNLGTVDWQANNLLAQGNVGIGTSVNPSYRLAVAGNIVAEEVRVALQANWPDYVFANDYQLPSLAVVEQYIKSKKHLMDIPSALDIEQHGIALGDMDAKLLRKIEELTLYAIEQEKQIQKLRQQDELISELLVRVKALELKLNNN